MISVEYTNQNAKNEIFEMQMVINKFALLKWWELETQENSDILTIKILRFDHILWSSFVSFDVIVSRHLQKMNKGHGRSVQFLWLKCD